MIDGLARETRRAWLQGVAEPFPVFLDDAPGPIGVVLCPPFGWEEMCSYRPRREWARAFAAEGVPAVRLDLPGQGEAGGGPQSPGRLAAWTDAIGLTATWLLEQSGCHRVVAVGMSLGGLLALLAAADGAPVDDFVLWGLPASGRGFTRELRAFGRMEANTVKPDDPSLVAQLLPEGAIAAGGYMLSAQTRQDLEALGDNAPALRHPDARAALLLERDGTAPPENIVEGLRAQGIEVEVAAGRGYGRMLVEPQFARLPADVAARTLA
ncbi:MAG: alpha/beta fold hydrolase, partial [Solirubrobacterales bacterium]|nr:alpha/beta fold hydrolase [Solirubrobacterales bacterium]